MSEKNFIFCSQVHATRFKNFSLMGKELCLKCVSVILCIALAGCANDQQRTKTQGSVIGAAGGAIIGGGLGLAAAVLTGNRNQAAQFIVAGAVAGATIGGMAGYRWGERVAYNKERYKTSEDRLKANIQRADSVRVAAAKENAELRGQIAELQRQVNDLSAASASGRDVGQARENLSESIGKRRQDVNYKIQCCNQEIADRKAALAEDGGGDPQQTATLKQKISQLSSERDQLVQANGQLAKISPRVGV